MSGQATICTHLISSDWLKTAIVTDKTPTIVQYNVFLLLSYLTLLFLQYFMKDLKYMTCQSLAKKKNKWYVELFNLHICILEAIYLIAGHNCTILK